jgi:uncharacterized protein involved in exopolysaccharide biosynthesis
VLAGVLVAGALAACGPTKVVAVSPSPDLPQPVCPASPAQSMGFDPTLSQIAHELAEVDRELDAIDSQLAASANAAGMTREQALAAVASRRAEVEKQAIDNVTVGAPLRISAIAEDYAAAHTKEAELAAHMGPKHPEMVELEHTLAWLRGEFEARRAAEIGELDAWRGELDKLPRAASARLVRQARLRAQRATLALAPSDAPAEVWLAAQDIADVSRELETMVDLGPKHPERVRAEAELADAKRRLTTAITLATSELDAELARLDSTTAAEIAIDAAKVSRRAELAAQARELRHAYELRSGR